MQVQEMEILIGARIKGDLFGVLVPCMHGRIVSAMKIPHGYQLTYG